MTGCHISLVLLHSLFFGSSVHTLSEDSGTTCYFPDSSPAIDWDYLVTEMLHTPIAAPTVGHASPSACAIPHLGTQDQDHTYTGEPALTKAGLSRAAEMYV
jgi:hypothetical protein